MRQGLTPVERGALYAKGQEVDRVPTSLINSETAGYLYGYDVQDSYFNVDAIVDIESKLFAEFGADCISVGPGLKGIAEALGAKLTYPKNQICFASDASPKSYDELGALSVLEPGQMTRRMQVDLESLNRLCDRFSGRVLVCNDVGGPVSTAATLRGYKYFLRDLRREPEQIRRLLDLAADSILVWIELVYRSCGAMPALAEPLVSGDLLSHELFLEFAKPAIEKVVQGAQRITGNAPGLHICGKSKYIWADIAALGVKSLSIDNQESLSAFKQAVGNTLGLGGNVSPVNALLNGTPAQVRQCVRDCLLAGSDNPQGYSLGPGCQIPIGTPRENLHAFMDAANTYGAGAVRGKLCCGVDKY